MIESTIINYLNEKLNVRSYMERPKTAPSEYILIEKTGSSKANHLCTATITVRAVSTSLAKAAALMEKAEKVLNQMPNDITGIGSAKLITDYNNTNTILNIHRYQAVYQINYHE